MAKPCCANQKFARHEDPRVADIGKAEGIEYTVGRCSSCGAWLIHGWLTAAGAQSTSVVDQALIDKFLATSGPARRKLLADWENSTPALLAREAARAIWLRRPKPPLSPGSVWGMAMSPFIPETWPARGDGRLVCYAYGVGGPARPADVEREISAPLARIVFGMAEGSVLAAESWSEELRGIGAQRMMSPFGPELEIADAAPDFDFVRRGGLPLDASEAHELRSFFGRWRSASGLIAAQIEPYHREFFRWIDAS